MNGTQKGKIDNLIKEKKGKKQRKKKEKRSGIGTKRNNKLTGLDGDTIDNQPYYNLFFLSLNM